METPPVLLPGVPKTRLRQRPCTLIQYRVPFPLIPTVTSTSTNSRLELYPRRKSPSTSLGGVFRFKDRVLSEATSSRLDISGYSRKYSLSPSVLPVTISLRHLPIRRWRLILLPWTGTRLLTPERYGTKIGSLWGKPETGRLNILWTSFIVVILWLYRNFTFHR